MFLGDVVDQLLNQHGLADPGAAEQADLATLGIGSEQVDDLDTGFEHLRRRCQLLDARGGLMDAATLGVGRQRCALVDRLAEHVEDPAERGRSHRNRDRATGVGHLCPPREAVGGVHRDSPHAVVTEVLLNLADQQRVGIRRDSLGLLVAAGAGDRDRVVDLGQLVVEDGLDHDPLDLLDVADVGRGRGVAGRLASA